MVAHADARGVLVAPQSSALPFDVNNYFYIANVPPGEARACHSSCSDEALIVVQGRVMVDLDNGVEQASVLLEPAQDVLCVHAGVYLRLYSFAPDTIMVVLASRSYSRGSRHDYPQPGLIGSGWEEV